MIHAPLDRGLGTRMDIEQLIDGSGRANGIMAVGGHRRATRCCSVLPPLNDSKSFVVRVVGVRARNSPNARPSFWSL